MVPVVSVILPVFNGELYLREAIDSVLNQSYENFELIIINDGSSDSSLKIISSYVDERIVIINRENRGLIYSLNEGINLARGKYIARMDADDVCLSKRFQKQVTYLESHLNIGVVGSFARLIFNDVLSTKVFKHPTENSEIKAKLFYDSPFIHPSVMIRKEILLRNNGYSFDYHRIEDFALWIKLADSCDFANIPEVLFHYRILNTSETRLGQNNSQIRHEALKSVFRLLFECNKIEYTEIELNNYAYSMYRRNFNKISFKELKNIYKKCISKSSYRISKYLFKRWYGIFIFNFKFENIKYLLCFRMFLK